MKYAIAMIGIATQNTIELITNNCLGKFLSPFPKRKLKFGYKYALRLAVNKDKASNIQFKGVKKPKTEKVEKVIKNNFGKNLIKVKEDKNDTTL